jgi:aconitate hydratase
MMLAPPLPPAEAKAAQLEKTPNITTLPALGRISDILSVPVLLKVGDDVSTDDIIPAGARVMPFWSNIPKVSEYAFEPIDDTYPKRARQSAGHVIVAGNNYGQGSSRENAALAPRYLGLEAVLAKSFARIHWQNLANFGVLPLTFTKPSDYEALQLGDVIKIEGISAALMGGRDIMATVNDKPLRLNHDLTRRQIDLLLQGGVINWLRERLGAKSQSSKVA